MSSETTDILGGFPDHKCSLPEEKQLLDTLIPGKGIFAMYKRKIKSWCLVSNRSIEARILYRSRAGLTYEINRQLLHHYYMVHPFSVFRHYWEAFMIIVYSQALIIFPLIVSLVGVEYGGHYECHEMYVLDYIAEVSNIFFIIEVLFFFITGYHKHDTKEVILNYKLIIRKRLWQLPIYIMAVIPISILKYISADNCQYMKTHVFLKFLFIFTFRRYLITFIDRIELNKYYVKFSINFITYLYCLHWIICLTFCISYGIQGNTKESVGESSWFRDIEIWNLTSTEIYAFALVRVIKGICLIGYKQKANSATEDIVIILVLYMGGIFQRVIICAQILAFIRNVTSSKEKYLTRYQQLHEFMRFKQVPSSLRQRLVDYYESRYQKNIYKENDILNTLTANLRQEINLFICRRLVEDVAFFADIPQNLLIRLVTCLDSEMFLANDTIITRGEIGDCMYFIGTGMVAVYDQHGVELTHLGDGAHFGEIALITETSTRMATVIAAQTCEMYVLNKSNFLKAMQPYPDIFQRMKIKAFERIQSDNQYLITDTHDEINEFAASETSE